MIDMLRFYLRKFFTALSLLFKSLSRITHRTSQELEVERWLHDRGDRSLRVNYPLGPESVVFDLGGYEGDWSAEILARYCCRVLIFEPVPEYALGIKQRFQYNPKAEVFPHGLGNNDATHIVRLAHEGSSIFSSPNVPKGSAEIKIKLLRASDFIESIGAPEIALIKINIEGGEYDLLEHLIDSGIIQRIKNIQVQFHNFVPDAGSRMRDIQRSLSATHEITYQYLFVWENWTRKAN